GHAVEPGAAPPRHCKARRGAKLAAAVVAARQPKIVEDLGNGVNPPLPAAIFGRLGTHSRHTIMDRPACTSDNRVGPGGRAKWNPRAPRRSVSMKTEEKDMKEFIVCVAAGIFAAIGLGGGH